MSMNMPQGMPTEVAPGVAKAFTSAATSLADLYMQIMQADPQSPAGEAALAMQRALGEISRAYGAPQGQPDAAMQPGGMPPDAASMPPEMMGGPPPMGGPEMGGMPPGPQMGVPTPESDPMGAAAADTHQMMLDAAMRRKEQ